MTTISKPSDIKMARLLTLKAALRLECVGMSKRGTSVYSMVKTEFGFKGTKTRVLEQLEEHIYNLRQKQLPFEESK
jgi:hypothetical protein